MTNNNDVHVIHVHHESHCPSPPPPPPTGSITPGFPTDACPPPAHTHHHHHNQTYQDYWDTQQPPQYYNPPLRSDLNPGQSKFGICLFWSAMIGVFVLIWYFYK